MVHRRSVLAGMAALGVSRAGAGFFDRADAVVSRTAKGSHVFASIGEAVAAAPGDRRFRIRIDAGDWRERVTVATPLVELVGAGRDKTRIVFNASAGDLGPDGRPIGTFGTPTVTVRAADFKAGGLAIANDFDYVAHLPGPVPGDKTGASGAQAVALAVEGEADRALFDDVHLSGHQDTLFVDAGRSLFRQSTVKGSVDFIFGAGRLVFEECEIVSRLRPGQEFNGYIAAPDTNRYQPYGMLFFGCRLTKEKGVAARSVALGRAWRRTGSFADGRYGDPDAVGAAAFVLCWMDDHIVPEGWYPMGYNAKGGGRLELQPEEARLYEFGSTGPGAGPASARRRILTSEQAKPYTALMVLDGWQP